MSTAAVNCDIKNIELADLGKKRIEWANQSMKVLQIIRKEFIKNQPLTDTSAATTPTSHGKPRTKPRSWPPMRDSRRMSPWKFGNSSSLHHRGTETPRKTTC